MMRVFHKRQKQTGVASIEFAVGFIFFWLMCMAWVEMSYLSYVSAIGDLAISQAALHSKRLETSTEFLADFKSTLSKSDSLWKYVADADDFTYSIRYISSYDDLSQVTENCKNDDSEDNSAECGTASDSAIAIYHISYNAPPIFNYFLDGDTLFAREAIVIQEYQRSDFNIN
ncbi:TadE/TadG family type IV pilus assembly protein [Vibrio nitrifigilis]|uniref:Pilus assembly protein n=1 Tax=Vibrio nitrifigilis TaxID=2789781 RepID=A0ABS0GIR7_9VIBR|nr:TadE family protein [Vibrio nitrifigilis]MBF9002232.1 pilus assembly protein [Vibrio nitrifigilis]